MRPARSPAVLLRLQLSIPLYLDDHDEGAPRDAVAAVARALAAAPSVPPLGFVGAPQGAAFRAFPSRPDAAAAVSALWRTRRGFALASAARDPPCKVEVSRAGVTISAVWPTDSASPLSGRYEALVSFALALLGSLGVERLGLDGSLRLVDEPPVALPLPARHHPSWSIDALLDVLGPHSYTRSVDPPGVREALRHEPLPPGATRREHGDLLLVHWCGALDDARERQRSLVRRALWLARRFGFDPDERLDEAGDERVIFLPAPPGAAPLRLRHIDEVTVLLLSAPDDQALAGARQSDRGTHDDGEPVGALWLAAPDRPGALALQPLARRHGFDAVHFLDVEPPARPASGSPGTLLAPDPTSSAAPPTPRPILRRLAPAGAWWQFPRGHVEPPFTLAEVDPGPTAPAVPRPAAAVVMPLARLLWKQPLPAAGVVARLQRAFEALPPLEGSPWTCEDRASLLAGDPRRLLLMAGCYLTRATHPILGPHSDTRLRLGAWTAGALDLAVVGSTAAQLDRDWELVTTLAAHLAPHLGADCAHAWLAPPDTFPGKLRPGRARPKAGLPPVLGRWNWLGPPHAGAPARSTLALVPLASCRDHEGGLLVETSAWLRDEPTAACRQALTALGVTLLPAGGSRLP